MLPLSSVRPGDIRHIRFSFACSRRQTTRRQSETPKDVPDHTSCRALSLHSLTDLFAGAPHPYYRTSAPFSSSVGERKIMNHFVVSYPFPTSSSLRALRVLRGESSLLALSAE